MQIRFNPQTALRVLIALAVFVALYQGRLIMDQFQTLFRPAYMPRTVLLTGAGGRVDVLTDAAAQAGIRKGDDLLAVNGHPYTGDAVLGMELGKSRPGDTMSFRIARDGGPAQVVNVVLQPYAQETWGRIAMILLLRVVTPWFCIVLGFLVAFQRPFDPLAWLLLGLMLSFSQVATGDGLIQFALGWERGVSTIAVLFWAACGASWPILMCLFGIYFPERSEFDRKYPWIKWVVTAPVAVFGIAATWTVVAAVENWRAAELLRPFLRSAAGLVFLMYSAPISYFYTNIGYKSGSLESPDARRRLRLLMWGSIISLTPIFIANLIGAIRHLSFDQLPTWFTVPALLLLFVFPATLAYIIVVQRAMELGTVVRTGLKYTLARGGVKVVQVAVVFGLLLYIAEAAAQAQMNRPRTMIILGLGITAILLLQRLGERASRWIDRRFFREAYNSEQILADLSDTVRTIVETKPLLETVGGRLAQSLHVQKLAMLLRDGDGYEPAYAIGYTPPPSARFSQDSKMIETLRKESGPLPVFYDNPMCWVHTLGREECDMLSKFEPEIVLPLAVKNEIHGFITLGAKQSEQPYSSADLRLLQSVAVQTGLALENTRLTAKVASEVAQRERLNREIEIAGEVQQRLFPQDYPAVEGLEYAGYCRPAQGVGGDYYDFVRVDGDYFGIAIGDVSGKGIPAALLMASLQACLRSQAIMATQDLARLMTTMNRLIFETSPSNRYATFFYGQYHPPTREFSYVNAGHNAPMVFRNGDVIRLETGGPVVGLFGAAAYEQGSVQLEPGDTLVGFTDGISEAMNEADDEFGEERMIATVGQCAGLCPMKVIERLMVDADAFSGTAPQHDDMTLVVVRVL